MKTKIGTGSVMESQGSLSAMLLRVISSEKETAMTALGRSLPTPKSVVMMASIITVMAR